jgi:gas vesicle protein
MRDEGAGDRAAYFLLGAAIGAVAALLLAPASGARTRRRLARKGEEVADYLMDAGKELVWSEKLTLGVSRLIARDGRKGRVG